MIELALLVVGGTLAVGLPLALRLLPSLWSRLAALALFSVALPLAATLASGLVMFRLGHDLVVPVSSSVAIVGALLIARSIAVPVGRLRLSSAALAGGDLGARAQAGGPTELAELGCSFNEVAARLEELFDARRQLVAWASHDLRTPLASMRAMLEALEDGIARPEEYLTALSEQVRSLGVLVDDLFELARLDAGALTLELREAALANLVESSLRGVEAEARKRRIQLSTSLDERTTVVRCAPDAVERVLLNLLTNASSHAQ